MKLSDRYWFYHGKNWNQQYAMQTYRSANGILWPLTVNQVITFQRKRRGK